MSLLLKSVWRGMLRTGFSESFIRSRSVSSYGSPRDLNIPLSPRLEAHETTSKVPEVLSKSDDAMARIKSAPSTAEVLSAVQAHLPALTHRHMLEALRCLFHLQRGSTPIDTEKLIKDPAFGMLCQNFKKHARALDTNEAVEATKVLSYLGVPVNSLIMQTMLQLVRYNINSLNIRQIMFLDFVLNKFESKNHLVDALKLALPLAFQIHLPLEVDSQDLPLLREMLSYACNHELPDRCINNVVTGLLLHDQAMDAQIAKSIIWALCQVNCTQEVYPTRVQLLHICCDILTQKIDQLSYEDVLRTAARVKGRVLEKHPEYYHEQLMDAIAGYVIHNDVPFEKALLVARVLSRIAHTHLGLVEYLCELAVSDPATLTECRTNILFGFVNCLSNNNYTPDALWDDIRRQVALNPVMDGTNSALPWTKFCLELASLGYYEDRLLKKIFTLDFLEECLGRENNTLDYLQLLTLHEAVRTFHSTDYSLPEHILTQAKEKYPIHGMTDHVQEYLCRALGNHDCVVKNVKLPNGIVADLLMCLKNGHPVSLHNPNTSSAKTPIQDLKIPPGGIVVCLMNFNQGCFSMNSNRLRGTFRLILDLLEKQGFACVCINTSEWQGAPPHERGPYLLREVGYRCGEIAVKLSAT